MDVTPAAPQTNEPAAALPAGIVTFLFTDIEASTQMLERHRAAAGPALARHHDLLRAAIGRSDGVVFETVGDAVYAAFSRPADALTAAVAIQRALADEEWGEIGDLRARIAVHTGAVESRGRHYFGPALFETARLQSLAHGGQVLTSAATSALAAADLDDGITLRAMGTHRLKDLLEPMEVFQVVAPGLPDRFPPLRAAIQAPTNLTPEATAFIGRVADLAAIEALLDEHRFVTLVGPGGTGKTRLAVESGLRRLDDFPDGAWIAELAPITDPDVVSPAIADVWSLRAINRSDLDDVIDRHLAPRRLLLIIDNCEHLLDTVAPMVERMLRASPGLSVIATSREPLGIAGETVHRVPSLSLPDEADDPVGSESVRLFVDRARLVRPDFSPADGELDAVLRICRRVDGMPLALELAAARLRTLSPSELADRLERSFHILTGGSRTALPRQRTLDATIDWSHEMLSGRERSVFRRLAAFAGGFDIPAAEAVCSGGGVDSGEVLDVLDSLVLKSLVLTIHGPSSRFRMLEPIRQYAQEVLAASGEAGETRRAHAHHYAALAADASPRTRGPEQMAWDRRLDVEYDNIRAALVTLREQGDLDRYLDLAFDLFAYWMHTGRHLDGIETAVAGVEAAPAGTDPVRLVKAWWTAATLGAEITREESIEHARAGLAVAERSGDPNLVGRMRLHLGAAIRHASNDPAYLDHLVEGRRLLDEHPDPHWWEPVWDRGLIDFICFAYLPPDDPRKLEHGAGAMSAFETTGDRVLLAATLVESAGMYGVSDSAAIIADLARANAMFEEMHVPYWHGHALMFQGSFENLAGNHAVAAEILARGVTQLEETGDLFCWATTSRGLADAEVALGRIEQARQRLAEVIRRMPVLPMPEIAKPRTLDISAVVLAAMGRPRDAAAVLGWAREVELPMQAPRRGEKHQALSDRLEAELGADVLDELMAEGARLDADELLARTLRHLEDAS
ncbi:MAG TPA: adenylate/guanylate cyclase domain-containing protein [Patescibacteria group bacterium]|nr:adenylate/guanylate cyclase domain-containing protein [Patescibacteria group bacterium]